MHITKDNINQFINGTSMDCSDFGITRLEYTPDGITHLYCYNNKLTKLYQYSFDKCKISNIFDV